MSGAYAQEEDVSVAKDLPSQYNALKEKSETYNDFKVIRESKLDGFWGIVEDSVSLLEQKLETANVTILSQKEETTELQGTIDEKNEIIGESDFAMTHISFLGINFTKSTYIIINVITISGLLILIGVGYFQYTHNKNIARTKIKEFDDIHAKFDDFKKISLDKQIKLNRELQTERNVVEEFRSKSTITKKITA